MPTKFWGRSILLRLLQEAKAALLMRCKTGGRFTSLSCLQPKNKREGMASNCFIVKLARLSCVQSENTPVPNEVRLSGRVIDSKAVQPLKAQSPTEESVLGRLIVLRLSQKAKALLPILVSEPAMLTCNREVQLTKAPSPIAVTEAAMVI